MKYTSAIATIFSIFLPITAMSAPVYSGCFVPALKATHSTFYVDPVGGSLSGDGSAAKPWKTLADVLDPANKLISTQGHAGAAYNNGTDTALHPVNPTAPVKAGDLILLKSGNHGAPTITNMYNSDFITVAAAPGATPVLSKLAVISSGKWMFQGLTFEGMATTATGATSASLSGAGLVTTGRGDWEGQTSDIVFSADTFRTAASTTGWTNYDWINKPYSMAVWMAAPCTSVTDSHLYNLLNGISIGAEKSLVQGDLIEKFSNDGMDLTASNVLVKNNTIQNGLNTTADPLHADGIQGWSTTSNGVVATNKNVVIDGNTIIKTGDTATTYMQGISIFDGKWTGLVIQNNVVVTNHWHGIALFGATGATIANNTVMGSAPSRGTWITINQAKDGTHSSGVVVRNNVSQTLVIADSGVTYDHNITAGSITDLVAGKSTVHSSGTVGTQNTIMPTIASGFNTFNTANGTFDLRLRPSSAAIGFGSASLAPALDIIGRTRSAPIDNGAYVH